MAKTPAKGPGEAAPATLFSQDLFDTICERISDGESLRTICSDPDMPNKATVFKWLAQNDALGDQYARARETQADAIFDEILDIADDARNDWMDRDGNEDAGYSLNGEHIQRSKLRIDARKWMAGKLRPKVYGEKVELDHRSGDGSMTPVTGFDVRVAVALEGDADETSG